MKVMKTVMYIQKIFKERIQNTKERTDQINDLWQKIHEDLLLEAKSRKPNQKVVMLAKKMHYITKEVKNALIANYIQACNYRHAMAFFQWRDRYGPNAGLENSLVKAVFQTRTNFLLEQEKRKQDLFQLAKIEEKKETQPLSDQEKTFEEEIKSLHKSDSQADNYI